MPGLIVTPVSRIYKPKGPCSRRDFEDQVKRQECGMQMMWDSGKRGSVSRHDVFAFVFHDRSVRVHRIEGVQHPRERLASWSRNAGHNDRRVLILSRDFHNIDWDTYKRLNITGETHLRSTRNVAPQRRSEFISHLRSAGFIS